jgi:hypothetical protein
MKIKNRKYIVITLAFVLFIGINIPYETTVPYKDTEYYTIEEPYIGFSYDNYTVIEPYIEDIPLDYIVLDAGHENSIPLSTSYVWINIKNNDTISGNFSVDFHITFKGRTFPYIATVMKKGIYISPGDTRIVKVGYNETIDEFRYEVIPPTKEVTKYKNVTMKRIETKYRKIQKTREVIKLKNESMSFIQRIFNNGRTFLYRI